MARQWRIEYEGALYHVLSRGYGKQAIFLNDITRQLSISLDHVYQQPGQRLTGEMKDFRNIMLYIIWQSGLVTNKEIGALFGITYSAVSHQIKVIRQNQCN